MTDAFPYQLVRVGTLMTPDPDDPHEVEGVLNPAAAIAPDGTPSLLPRLVAAGNRSRIGLAEVLVEDGRPRAVARRGVVLEPERSWERGADHAGVEDPRVTWIGELGRYVMTYVAYGPLGPRNAMATSVDLVSWTRIGPVQFEYDDELAVDLNLYPNKDAALFPEPVTMPDGGRGLALVHRPTWDLGAVVPGEGVVSPPGDPRPSIWISFLSLDEALRDPAALTRWRMHTRLVGPEHPFEALKIGAGPAPMRTEHGWLLLHHGVTGEVDDSTVLQQRVRYAAGAMLLDPDRPWVLRSRTATPLLEPVDADERDGPVPNVVFPTAMQTIGDRTFVYYGMADHKIGVAELLNTRDHADADERPGR